MVDVKNEYKHDIECIRKKEYWQMWIICFIMFDMISPVSDQYKTHPLSKLSLGYTHTVAVTLLAFRTLLYPIGCVL